MLGGVLGAGRGARLLFRSPHRAEATAGPWQTLSESRTGREADLVRSVKGTDHGSSAVAATDRSCAQAEKQGSS